MGLSDGEIILMTGSTVLVQITRVTDGRTDGISVAYTRYSIYAVARKKHSENANLHQAAPSISLT